MRNAHCALTMTCALATAGVGMSAATAVAQEAEILPAIVVEGATLDTSPRRSRSTKRSLLQQRTSALGEDSRGGICHRHVLKPEMSAASKRDATERSAPGTDDTVQGVPDRQGGHPPVSVVTGAELRARQIRNAADALRSLPGVRVSSQGGRGQSLTRFASAELKATRPSSSSTAWRRIDTSDGEFDFSNLSADDIDQIEVIRGVQSGLIWSRAIGGVINIVTQRRQGTTDVSMAAAKAAALEPGTLQAASPPATIAAILQPWYRFPEADGFNIAPNSVTEKDGCRAPAPSTCGQA